MNNKERAMNILHFKDVDRLPAVHFGYWAELLEEWAAQGKIPKVLVEKGCGGLDREKELTSCLAGIFIGAASLVPIWAFTQPLNPRNLTFCRMVLGGF